MKKEYVKKHYSNLVRFLDDLDIFGRGASEGEYNDAATDIFNKISSTSIDQIGAEDLKKIFLGYEPKYPFSEPDEDLEKILAFLRQEFHGR